MFGRSSAAVGRDDLEHQLLACDRLRIRDDASQPGDLVELAVADEVDAENRRLPADLHAVLEHAVLELDLNRVEAAARSHRAPDVSAALEATGDVHFVTVVERREVLRASADGDLGRAFDSGGEEKEESESEEAHQHFLPFTEESLEGSRSSSPR